MEKILLKVPLKNIENILGTVTSPSIVLSELIKNSVDSNSEDIKIEIFTKPNNHIVITDHGDGFSLSDIKNLGVISESTKKINGNLYREDGSFLTGSKGLGILSLFSIANDFTMETEKDGMRYRIEWSKGQSSYTFGQINAKCTNGTEIIVKNIADEYMSILTDENELNKLKHISIKNYIDSSLNKKDISFFINGNRCSDLDITSIGQLKNFFVGTLNFHYDSKSNKLTFKYLFKNEIVNKNEIMIQLDNNLCISDILERYYNVTNVYYKGVPYKYMEFPLESFYGEIFVTEQKRNEKLLEFGHGVRVFVNQFAMYGYLDSEYDWLNFSDLSMTKKNTRFKPHNVYGYVHFENLNENESYLKISNERAYFIENGAFKKFKEIMKDLVTAIVYNIDVAERNGWINCESFEERIQEENIRDGLNNNVTMPSSGNREEQSSNPQDGNNQSENTGNQPESIKSNELENESNGIQNTIIEYDKKPQFNFFKTSGVLKHPGKIEIEYDELINQLSKLDYKKCYLLFVIAFRAILEDISKNYLNARSINLSGDFGHNIKLMVDDVLLIVKDENIISKQDKIYIENLFGGYNAFRNYFDTLGPEFYLNGLPGNKAKILNSYTHTPRWMEIEEAENYANNIILPLVIVSKEIIARMKK